MFVQSADFIKAHKKSPDAEIAVYGQERVEEYRHLSLMNLAVHALSGDIRQGNSYYEDLHSSVGQFDFVSHCYRRPRRLPQWRYNLFAMVHGPSREALQGQITQIAALLGEHVHAQDVLYSTRILKKTGLRLAP